MSLNPRILERFEALELKFEKLRESQKRDRALVNKKFEEIAEWMTENPQINSISLVLDNCTDVAINVQDKGDVKID